MRTMIDLEIFAPEVRKARLTCPDCGTVVRGISMAEHIVVWCEADIPRLIDILMKRGWSHPNHKQTPELLHSSRREDRDANLRREKRGSTK